MQLDNMKPKHQIVAAWKIKMYDLTPTKILSHNVELVNFSLIVEVMSVLHIDSQFETYLQ